MRGLTAWQPYATLLAIGAKPYETRSWWTNYRGLVAIHAAKKPVEHVLRLLPEETKRVIFNALSASPVKLDIRFPLGAVVGVGNLVACHLIDDEFISKLTYEQRQMGDFTPGRYAWEFRDVTPLMKPVKMLGAQCLWYVKNEDEVLLRGECNVKAAAC
jgi:hypothetical protein